MKKYKYLIILFAFIFIPNIIKAEVIELFQEDFDQMKETGETIKGICFQEAAGFNISSGNYKLGENIFLNYGEGIWLGSNDNVTLDLNNKTINSNGWTIEVLDGTSNLTINGSGIVYSPEIPILNSGNLTINGNIEVVGTEGDFSNISPLISKVSILNSGTLTINNGSYTGTIITADNSSAIIKNGSFNDNSVALVAATSGEANVNSLRIDGGTFNGGLMGVYIDGVNNVAISRGTFEGTLAGIAVGQHAFVEANISGGKFKASDNGYGGFTVLGNYPEGTFKSVINSVLSNGYKFDNVLEYYQSNDNTFGTVSYSQKEISVVEGEAIVLTQEDFVEAYESKSCTSGNDESEYICNTPISVNGVNYYEDFDFYYFYLDSGNYKLGSNINTSEIMYNSMILMNNVSVTIDLNNNNISSCLAASDSQLIINGSGELSGLNSFIYPMNYQSLGSNIVILSDGDNSQLVLNGGTYRGAVIISNNATGVINGGSFYSDGVALASMQIKSLTINDGYFEGNTAGLGLLGNADSVIITGGTFKGGTAGLINAGVQIKSAEVSGGKYISTSEEGFGGFAAVFGNNEIDEEGYINMANSILKTGYMYYEPIEYNHTTVDNYGFVAYTQKEISVIPSTDEYEIIEGENQTYKDSDIVIKADGDIELFEKLLVDGEEVDEENYTVERGSTIVTLKKEYIDSLSEGEHTVTFVYANGQVSATFNKTISNMPETLDNIYSYIIMLIVSLTLIVINKKQLNF